MSKLVPVNEFTVGGKEQGIICDSNKKKAVIAVELSEKIRRNVFI